VPGAAVLLIYDPGLALHGVRFLAALFFWFTLLTISDAARWQAMPALLLTGKLSCLPAALLIYLIAAVIITMQLIGRPQASAAIQLRHSISSGR
jgi:hypothetical protein